MKDTAIAELLMRGVEKIFPNAAFLESRLKSGERLTVYLGIDPTGPTLHVGHMIPLLKLRQFQDLGHHVIFLIGDLTATIGDPTDKISVRASLTRQQVMENARQYKAQASHIISFDGDNKAEILFNSTWLEKLSLEETFNLFASITYAQTIKRSMFQKRLAEGKDLYMHEFLYPVMQGYDSVAMNVDGEVGGNDQTFNMLVGRDLLKKMKHKEKFVMATKLLTDSTGAKMGKTEGNLVAFSDTPADCFGKVMSWPDTMILAGFELCTRVPLTEIEEIKDALSRGENPKSAKERLAFEITALLKDAKEAEKARASFDSTFAKGEPMDFIEIARSGDPMMTLIEKGIVASKTELRRLITAGAVTQLDSNTKVLEDFAVTFPIGKYRIGKHKFIHITK